MAAPVLRTAEADGRSSAPRSPWAQDQLPPTEALLAVPSKGATPVPDFLLA